MSAQPSRKKQKNTRPHGELRQSQILTSYGPGAMVDLPDYSIIIGGLNQWRGYEEHSIREERLAQRVNEVLGCEHPIDLYAPPHGDGDPDQGKRPGIAAFVFPKWFVAQVEKTYKSPSEKTYQTRPLVPQKRLIKGKYEDENRKKYPVVPVRFVQACRNGHISDIDWYLFVNPECRSNCPAQLWLDEGGTGNDFADIFVRCTKCHKRRPLSDTTIKQYAALGYCKGERPWLGEHASEKCCMPDTKKPDRNRLLVRSASNAYFSQLLSVISLPETDEPVKEAVEPVYEDLKEADLEDIIYFRRKIPKIRQALEGFSDEEIWEEVQRRQQGTSPPKKTIKQVEIETLLSAEKVGEDTPGSNFYAYDRGLNPNNLPSALQGKLDRVVLVPRLREVMAQVGFTRFEPAMPDVEGELPEELEMTVGRAALDIDTTWVPAIEQRGEGVFLSFNEKAIETWLQQPEVKQRGKELQEGFKAWCKRHNLSGDKKKVDFPGLPYIMLHSLSHLLITTVSLECGYSASAIKERVYAGKEGGYGILLYTGSSSSEGTLGGLIEVGKEIEHYLMQALREGQLCSNDPLCAQHEPHNTQEERFLHGSACHGCLLIAEPSCERSNEFLDRVLVRKTVNDRKAEFFTGEF